jgi:hypothetical protein
MVAASHLKLQPYASGKIRSIGRSVIGASLLVLIMYSLALVQTYPGVGEIAHFTYDSSIVIIPMTLWGVATGFGLLRAWRWSRISMLIFGTMLTLFSAVPGIAFLLTKQEGFSWWAVVLVKLCGLLFLIPAAMVARWFWYFVGDEARIYFRTAAQAPSARS